MKKERQTERDIIIKDEQEVSLNDEDVNHTEYRTIDVWNKENPMSVYNMVTPKLQEFMDKVPWQLRNTDPHELRKIVKPTERMNKLRLLFWHEYDRTLSKATQRGGGGQRRMYVNNLCAGVCNRDVFYSVIKNPEHFSWILMPVTSYKIQVEEILETCLYKMRRGLENLNPKKSQDLTVIMRIYENFDKRIHGEYKKSIQLEDNRENGAKKVVDNMNSQELLEEIHNMDIIEINKED